MSVLMGILVCCILDYFLAWVDCTVLGSGRFHNNFHMVLVMLHRGYFHRVPGMVHYLAGEDMCYLDVQMHKKH